jgi:hypothetical protein
MDTGQKTESIKDPCDRIQRRDIVLPEFQRDFVWDITQTFELFDSLIRDIFIGSLIYGIPSFAITVREIDTRPRKGLGSRKKLTTTSLSQQEVKDRVKMGDFRLLLDGQQRATSLMRTLKGIDEVWIILKHEYELHADVKSKVESDRALEEVFVEVSGRQSQTHLSIKISDVYELFEARVARDYEKAAVLARSEYIKKLGVPESEVEDHALFETFLIYSKKVHDLFKSEKLLSFYMLDTDAEKFALFFERSNSRGIQLSFIDILAAKLYSGFNLREEASKLVEETQLKGERELQEILVRSIAYAVSSGKEIERKYILTKLDASHFTEHWSDMVERLKRAMNYLSENHLLLAQEWFPYPNMLIPLTVFVGELPSQEFSQISARQSAALKLWYWDSIFVQRYSIASNAVILEDALMLSKLARNSNGLERAFFKRIRPKIDSYDDLISINKQQNAIYKGFLNFVGYINGGLRDWRNGDRLTFNTDVDDHHIFPKKYLSKLPGEEVAEVVDSILNRALIPKRTNIKLGGQRPSIYLKELEKSNPTLRKSLENHLIPVEIIEGIWDENSLEFLKTRGDTFAKVFNEHLDELEKQLFGEPLKSRG